jgi:hypothetical protein
MLRRILGPRREKVIGGCKNLHNEELHNLYHLRNFIRVVISRKMTWAGYIAHMVEMRN